MTITRTYNTKDGTIRVKIYSIINSVDAKQYSRNSEPKKPVQVSQVSPNSTLDPKTKLPVWTKRY